MYTPCMLHVVMPTCFWRVRVVVEQQSMLFLLQAVAWGVAQGTHATCVGGEGGRANAQSLTKTCTNVCVCVYRKVT